MRHVGAALMMSPAAVAVVRAMPDSMQIENRKLPKNDCRKSVPLFRRTKAMLPAGNENGSMTTAASAKRIRARR